MLNDVQCAADDDCGNAFVFQVAGNQTHGLVANGSDRDHYGDIGAVFP